MSRRHEAPASTIVFGPLKVPTAGNSAITLAFSAHLEGAGHRLAQVDTHGPLVTRFRLVRRFIRWPWAFGNVFGRLRWPSISYVAYPNGEEMIPATALVILLALRSKTVLVHHHQRWYAQRKARTLSVLGALDRRGNIIHLTQCEWIAKGLRDNYGFSHVVTLSNAAFVEPSDRPVQPNSEAPDTGQAGKGPLRLGYLGRLTRSKGIVEFVDTLLQLATSGTPVEAIVAGPLDPDLSEAQLDRLRAHDVSVTYLGVLDAAGKTLFFDQIDALLFPSYTEAEPVVVLEALANDVPVFATDVGCLPALIDQTCGATVPLDQYVATVGDALASLDTITPGNPRARFDTLHTKALAQLDDLMSTLDLPSS